MTVLGGSTTGGPVSRRWPVSVGALTTTSSDGFSSPPERGPHVGEGAVLGRRQRDGERHRQAEVRQRPASRSGGIASCRRKQAQQRREQPVLVLGPLGPGGDQVRQLEVPGRQVPADDPAVAVVLVLQPALAAAHVLADVVEVDVDGGRVAPAGPVLGRGVEDHLDVAVRERLGPDQRPQRLVDLLDHLPRSHPRPSQRASHRCRRAGSRGGGRPEGQRGPPDRAADGDRVVRKATFMRPRGMKVAFLQPPAPGRGGGAGIGCRHGGARPDHGRDAAAGRARWPGAASR